MSLLHATIIFTGGDAHLVPARHFTA